MNIPRMPLVDEEHDVDNQLLKVAELTLSAIGQGRELIETGDLDLASEIVEADQAINEACHHIEESCVISIARQQPVASDLRMLMSGSHMAVELERIADHVVGAAKTLMNITGDTLGANRAALLEMTDQARSMVNQAVKAFMDKDAEVARALAAEDTRLDAMQDQLTAHLMASFNHNSVDPEETSRLLWVVHDLERMGDRALNIAERVIYMVDAKVVELNH